MIKKQWELLLKSKSTDKRGTMEAPDCSCLHTRWVFVKSGKVEQEYNSTHVALHCKFFTSYWILKTIQNNLRILQSYYATHFVQKCSLAGLHLDHRTTYIKCITFMFTKVRHWHWEDSMHIERLAKTTTCTSRDVTIASRFWRNSPQFPSKVQERYISCNVPEASWLAL